MVSRYINLPTELHYLIFEQVDPNFSPSRPGKYLESSRCREKRYFQEESRFIGRTGPEIYPCLRSQRSAECCYTTLRSLACVHPRFALLLEKYLSLRTAHLVFTENDTSPLKELFGKYSLSDLTIDTSALSTLDVENGSLEIQPRLSLKERVLRFLQPKSSDTNGVLPTSRASGKTSMWANIREGLCCVPSLETVHWITPGDCPSATEAEYLSSICQNLSQRALQRTMPKEPSTRLRITCSRGRNESLLVGYLSLNLRCLSSFRYYVPQQIIFAETTHAAVGAIISNSPNLESLSIFVQVGSWGYKGLHDKPALSFDEIMKHVIGDGTINLHSLELYYCALPTDMTRLSNIKELRAPIGDPSHSRQIWDTMRLSQQRVHTITYHKLSGSFSKFLVSSRHTLTELRLQHLEPSSKGCTESMFWKTTLQELNSLRVLHVRPLTISQWCWDSCNSASMVSQALREFSAKCRSLEELIILPCMPDYFEMSIGYHDYTRLHHGHVSTALNFILANFKRISRIGFPPIVAGDVNINTLLYRRNGILTKRFFNTGALGDYQYKSIRSSLERWNFWPSEGSEYHVRFCDIRDQIRGGRKVEVVTPQFGVGCRNIWKIEVVNGALCTPIAESVLPGAGWTEEDDVFR